MTSIPVEHGRVTVRSPEGVELEFSVAGPASRMAAYALDWVAVIAITVAVLVLLGASFPLLQWINAQVEFGTLPAHKQDVVRWLAPLLVMLYTGITFSEILYFALWETASRGLTPGKYLMRLRVVGIDGQPLEPKAALLRNALRAIDTLPASYLVGLVTMVISKSGQRLGDHAAGTWVVRTDRTQRPKPIDMPDGLPPLVLSRVQLAKLGRREIALLRATLRRLPEISATQQHELVDPVVRALCTRLAIEAAEVSDPTRFLEQLLLTSELIHKRGAKAPAQP
jgi:uncharacterized RDD family membrane protein YckC